MIPNKSTLGAARTTESLGHLGRERRVARETGQSCEGPVLMKLTGARSRYPSKVQGRRTRAVVEDVGMCERCLCGVKLVSTRCKIEPAFRRLLPAISVQHVWSVTTSTDIRQG